MMEVTGREDLKANHQRWKKIDEEILERSIYDRIYDGRMCTSDVGNYREDITAQRQGCWELKIWELGTNDKRLKTKEEILERSINDVGN